MEKDEKVVPKKDTVESDAAETRKLFISNLRLKYFRTYTTLTRSPMAFPTLADVCDPNYCAFLALRLCIENPTDERLLFWEALRGQPAPAVAASIAQNSWRDTINDETWRRGVWSDLSMHYIGPDTAKMGRQWKCDGKGRLMASSHALAMGEVIVRDVPIHSVILLPDSKGTKLASCLEETPSTLVERVDSLESIRSHALHRRDSGASQSFSLWSDNSLREAFGRLADQWTLRMRESTSPRLDIKGDDAQERKRINVSSLDREAARYEAHQFGREYCCSCGVAQRNRMDQKARHPTLFANRTTLNRNADEVDPLLALLPHALEYRSGVSGSPLAIIFPGELIQHAIRAPEDDAIANALLTVEWRNQKLVGNIVASRAIKLGEPIVAALSHELACFDGYDRCARYLGSNTLKLHHDHRMVALLKRFYDEASLIQYYPHMISTPLLHNIIDTIIVLARHGNEIPVSNVRMLRLFIKQWLGDETLSTPKSHEMRAIAHWARTLLRLL